MRERISKVWVVRPMPGTTSIRAQSDCNEDKMDSLKAPAVRNFTEPTPLSTLDSRNVRRHFPRLDDRRAAHVFSPIFEHGCSLVRRALDHFHWLGSGFHGAGGRARAGRIVGIL